MNEKKKLQPKVRFREFTGENALDWEQRKLGEVCNEFDYGLNVAAKEYDGINKYLRITDIDDDSREFNFDNLTSPDISNNEITDEYLLRNGDILFARTGASVGKTYLYKELDGKVYFAGFLIRARVGIDNYPYFIFQTTLTEAYAQFVKVTSQRSGQPGINAKEYSKYKIYIPKYFEQQMIGTLFEKLDKLITLHQRKLEQLEQLKNTLLSKMFPKSGTNIPEIRFSGFTDAWKQRKAKEIFITISEKGHIDLPVLSASQEFGMVERNNIGIDIKYDLNSIKNYKRVLPKQFVIHLRSFQGGFAWSTIEGITSPAYTVIDFIEKSNQDFGFWKIFLTSTNFIKKLETVTYGIRDGRSISFNDFSSMNFVIPNINEQERIGNLFQKIDNYIAIHQRKLEQLKNLKQTLLNKMFI